MKRPALAALLAFLPLFPASGDAVSLTGKWLVEMSIAGIESTQSCAFTQTGGELAGACESTNGTVKIAGKVEGKKAAWSYKTEYNGNPLTVAYEATVESAEKITGTVNVPEYGVEGTFTASLSK